MKYSEIELLLSTYSYCKDDAENCDECPWVKNKGNCDFDEEEWSLKLYEACWELLRTVENLHADISELQEDNSRLELDKQGLISKNKNLDIANEGYKKKLAQYNESLEQHCNMILAQREAGRQLAINSYYKDVRIAELNIALEALSAEKEEP